MNCLTLCISKWLILTPGFQDYVIMETNEIIFLVALFALAGYSLYRRYIKKNTGVPGRPQGGFSDKGGLKGETDDYEPYSGTKGKNV